MSPRRFHRCLGWRCRGRDWKCRFEDPNCWCCWPASVAVGFPQLNKSSQNQPGCKVSLERLIYVERKKHLLTHGIERVFVSTQNFRKVRTHDVPFKTTDRQTDRQTDRHPLPKQKGKPPLSYICISWWFFILPPSHLTSEHTISDCIVGHGHRNKPSWLDRSSFQRPKVQVACGYGFAYLRETIESDHRFRVPWSWNVKSSA